MLAISGEQSGVAGGRVNRDKCIPGYQVLIK